ncbi:MAG: hypothetical protein D6748_13560 [Calditrichaeota bacterium]|nr:MAG: hypothetical protein D6748_13560 [Calditrichota bacterium]
MDSIQLNISRWFNGYGSLILAIILLHCLWSSGAVLSQQMEPEVQQVKQLYDSLEFEKAISIGQEVLKSRKQISLDGLVIVHRYMALSFYNVGEQDSARSHFLSLLSLNPDEELDPVFISPKIIEFFNKIKEEYLAQQATPTGKPFTRYVLVDDPRPGAGWRSALIPGWGQFYKHQPRKGILIGGAFWSSLLFTGFAALKEKQTHQDYRDAVSPKDIDARYNTYNRWYRTRQIMTYTTLLLWSLSVGDALWSGYPTPVVTLSTGEVQFSYIYHF